jgi:hypothetical protein
MNRALDLVALMWLVLIGAGAVIFVLGCMWLEWR